ncbi:hypothetical protein JCM3765_000732 [Sporobolomyces pararoseus]
MSILPAVGTKYESKFAFQLDVFERGLQHLLNIKSQKLGKQGRHGYTMRCAYGSASGEGDCSFGITAKPVEGQFMVIETCDKHSCSAERRVRHPGKIRKMMSGRVDALEEHIAKNMSKSAESKASSGTELNTAKAPKEKDKGASKAEDLEDFPTVAQLEFEIVKLMKTTPLAVPLQGKALAARPMLVLLHAWSRQEGFSIYRRCPPSRESFKMFCKFNHPRFSDSMRGRCDYVITIKSDNGDGRWRVKEITGTHNHSLTSSSTSISTSLPQQQAPSPGASISSKSLENKKRSISEVSSEVPKFSAALEALPPPLKSRKRFMGPSLLEPEPCTFPPVDQTQFSLYPSDLVSFLKSFDSRPSTLLETLSSFDQLGIKSIEVLTTLLSTSRETFQKFVESVEGVTRDKLEEIALDLRKDLARR